MIHKRLDDITSDDIRSLVSDKISERKTLEYKAQLKVGTKDETAEFLADISSFANAAGGDIIFGISDERGEDNNPTGIPEAITPLAITNEDTERGRISQIIDSGIQPRIPGVDVKVIHIPESGSVIVIRVPRSWIGPHMVSYANRSRFFSRNGIQGRQQLDVQQIGAAFAQQRGLGERLRDWKTERIGRAIAGDGPLSLQGAQILFHFVSAPALMDGEPSLPRAFDANRLLMNYKLMYMHPESYRYNADGLLISTHQTRDGGKSYLQIFRDGSLEYGDSAILQSHSFPAIASQIVETKIMHTFANALGLLTELETPEPIYVSLTLIGMKGRTMALPQEAFRYGYTTDPFDRDTIFTPDMLVENLNEGYPYASTLRPIVDSLWQAAGRECTPYVSILWQPSQ